MSDENKQELIDLNINTQEYSSESVFEHINNIRKTISGLAELVGRIALSDYSSNLVEAIKNVIKIIALDDTNLRNALQYIRNTFQNIIQNLSVPGIQEDKKQELVDSYIRWGTFGWTINPCDDFNRIYEICPEDPKEANKLALKSCRNMDNIFNYIREEKRVKKSDFEEAVEDFNGRRYKSCALVLFSLIDGKLIRFSGRSKEGKEKRPYGKGAIEVIKKKIDFDYERETLFMALFCVNLFACIEKVFEHGGDFKQQPGVVNRNFLCHGMLTKKVSRKDCIQLFLLYYNILELADMIYDK